MRVRAGIGCALLALAAILAAGCSLLPRGEEPVDEPVDEPTVKVGKQWRCAPLDGIDVPELRDKDETWMTEGGRMASVHRSWPSDPDTPGAPNQRDALWRAVASAAGSALDLLEQRGVAYSKDRRREIINEVAEAVRSGDEITFPRMDVVASEIEKCVASDGDTITDTGWKASILVEYPIGHLKGDANNVKWERSRAANEARTLRASAEDYLERGRWLQGLLETDRVADVILGTGISTDTVEVPSDGEESTDESSVAELTRHVDWAQRILNEVAPLSAVPAGGSEVLEVSSSLDAEVKFLLSYQLNGRKMRAVGVPVLFDMPGASAVLDAVPVTDGDGAATCRIASAHGAPGDYELSVALDLSATEAALERAWDSTYGGAGAQGGERDHPVLATTTVHLVQGTHATSVCVDLGDPDDVDVTQALAGLVRRLERSGFRVLGCAPDVDVVITGDLSLATSERSGEWTSDVVLTATAFDQRSASTLGETTITVSESAGASAPASGRRDAEVLALKEAGRLLAVHFESRILLLSRR